MPTASTTVPTRRSSAAPSSSRCSTACARPSATTTSRGPIPTRWNVLATYQNDESENTISFLPHSGTVLPNPNGQIPVERFTSEPGFDRFEVEKYAVTSLLEWQVSPVWTLRQNFRLADNDNPYYTMYPDVFSGPDPDNPFYPYLDETRRTIA